MSLANPINVYTCEVCSGETVTIDVDEGVTPFYLDCRATKGCSGIARSSMYRPRAGHASPTWEWYRPTQKQARKSGAAMAEHVRLGGLDIRRRPSTNDGAPS